MDKASKNLQKDITLEETIAALNNLADRKAPCPDKIYTELLRNASDELILAIHYVFQRSFELGQVPTKWKTADIKFIRKSEKDSYHEPSSYRPISLTSCLSKCLEKILTTRLIAFVENKRLIDAEQEGFRRFHSTENAVLRLTQCIYNGFNDNLVTLAAFIDLEKAYDSVWHDGLLVNCINLESQE